MLLSWNLHRRRNRTMLSSARLISNWGTEGSIGVGLIKVLIPRIAISSAMIHTTTDLHLPDFPDDLDHRNDLCLGPR